MIDIIKLEDIKIADYVLPKSDNEKTYYLIDGVTRLLANTYEKSANMSFTKVVLKRMLKNGT